MVHVALMGRSIRPRPAGVGRYAANLVDYLCRELPARSLTVFLTRDAPPHSWPGVVEVRASIPTPNEYARALWEQTIVPARVAALGIDVYHSPNYILPTALTCPSVVTIHDVAYLQPRLHRAKSHLYLTVLTALALRRATIVVAVSEHTRRAVERHYPRVRGRIEVIAEGVDPALQPPIAARLRAFRQRLGLTEPYILFVGTLEPRKNLARLVTAFERAVRASDLPHHLVLAGNRGWKNEALDQAIDASPCRERIHRVGYVSDADLPCWYAGAALVAYPSLEEGFGLPPLEAMACGAPVVTSNCSAIPEVVGEAALTVDPLDVEALASAMGRVLTEPALAEALRALGRIRAKQFSWEEVARRYRTVYERAASGESQ
ncbi:MAG TPA: glycosyltransferase family 1 protein [Chloroflexota bacterium]|jgi:glycosyltransferase involved in cell wall biosynthesis|nr:glycosyltransferase family 1 protein [Chloroflexota bacterium]